MHFRFTMILKPLGRAWSLLRWIGKWREIRKQSPVNAWRFFLRSKALLSWCTDHKLIWLACFVLLVCQDNRRQDLSQYDFFNSFLSHKMSSWQKSPCDGKSFRVMSSWQKSYVMLIENFTALTCTRCTHVAWEFWLNTSCSHLSWAVPLNIQL